MGVVYEVLDSERGETVALKTLRDLDADGLYRFKQEFRTLTDLVHPNIVRLYELVVGESEGAFFTMELVPGIDFLTYVCGRSGARVAGEHSRIARLLPTTPAGPTARRLEDAPAQPTREVRPIESCSADLDKLRSACRQLAEGVHALHGAGQLHRDLKPSNVLVAGDGRVVVLDLGVATSLRRDRLLEPSEMVGTATYMAPEQALGDTPTPAADWYSFGVILYESLVGRPPFLGRAADVIAWKNIGEPIPPSECIEGVPPDLDELCVDLLKREPRDRPTGLDVLRRLHTAPTAPERSSSERVHDPSLASELLGRQEQLAALREAFERVVSGSAVTVRLSGESGMGKSAVASTFLDGLAARGEALVLRGRAYERESLPYKAVDSVIDEVSRALARAEAEGDPIDLPGGVGALARVFPVLRRVPGLANANDDSATEPRELRSRAFEALRSLLGSLAKRRALVVYIDDAHWGDADSASLVLALVRAPEAPPLLLLMTYRSNEAAGSVFLNDLRDGWPRDAEVRDLALGPLDPDAAETLALTLLDGSGDRVRRMARAVARESRGSPFLVQELARSHAASGPHDEETLSALTLETMVSERLERLPADARRMIEIVAVGGRPLPLAVVGRATGVTVNLNDTIASLCARRFARMGQRDGRDVVETTHDRIRETIGGLLTDVTLREHHGALARALEEEPEADAEAIAQHWLRAGDAERAVHLAEEAAGRSADKLAFDHAARLVRLALDNTSPASGRAQGLRVRLAQMLEAAGRSSEAADEYRKAAQGTTAFDRLELERSAAEQLVLSGRIDEGALGLRRVLAVMGMRAPQSSLGAMFALVFYQLRLRILGLRFRERAAEEVSSEDRVRVETLRAVGMGLSAVDVILGACMQARHLFLAMAVGDRMQVLRALCIELVQFAIANQSEGKRERAMVEIARGLAAREGIEGQLYFDGARGLASYLRGRFLEARGALDAVVDESRKVANQMTATANLRLFAVFAAFHSGALREEAHQGRLLLRDVEERGDVYTAVSLRMTIMVDVALAADEPDEARRHLRSATAQWTSKGFSVQHWYAMFSEAEVELYVGDGARAYARIDRDSRALKKSFLLHSRFIRAYTAYVRGCSAVASAEADVAVAPSRLREARRIAQKLERDPGDWVRALASLVRAVAANAEGERAEAIEALRIGLQRTEAASMLTLARAARYQLGLLVGGDEGAELVAEAERAMTREGVRAPARMAGFMLPGRWSPTRG
jgi:serine/threonine protein kinase/tetratricopeptide (TPR) repeat protein